MTEREKVIKGIECCNRWNPTCEECPYNDGGDTCPTLEGLFSDALALLKAQEPVEPKAMQEGWYCSNCGGTVGFFDYSGDKVCGEITYNYCPDCGRKVKWDD